MAITPTYLDNSERVNIILNEIETEALKPVHSSSYQDIEDRMFNIMSLLSDNNSIVKQYIKEHECFKEKLKNFFYHSQVNRLILRNPLDPSLLPALKRDAEFFSSINIRYILSDSPDKEQESLKAQQEYVQSALSNAQITQISKKGRDRSTAERLSLVAQIRKKRDTYLEDSTVYLKGFQQMVDAIAREIERREKADRLADELIAENASKSKNKKSRKIAQPKRAHQIEQQKAEQSQPKQEADPVVIKETSPHPESFDAKLKARKPPFTFAPRVRRWQKATADIIRTFIDSSKRHYAKIEDDTEVLRHRLYHNTEGLEYIFCDESERKKYTFSTPTGLGMMVSLKQGEEVSYGIIYFGIDTKKVIYHRQFVPLKQKYTAEYVMDQSHMKLPGDSASKNENWRSDMGFTFYLENENIIRIEYDEGFEISVFHIKHSANSD